MKIVRLFPLLCLLAACAPELPEEVQLAYQDLPEEIDFNFHVKPILSDRCYKCHGPDEEARKAELRLDIEEEAMDVLRSGKPHKSTLIQRILSMDNEEVMPPVESNLALTHGEKAILVKWIEQGAQWKDHWAFMIPEAPAIPPLPNQKWTANNEIDHFIFDKVYQEGLYPNSIAEKQRLLRRVTMDLTGLPPTVEEIRQFLSDEGSEAYENVVDKLLDSEACAERLAMDWMDLARYADSHGLHADGYRMMWPWRDWVIEAFKSNMPYDEFVTWQLAGDLMDHPSRDQKLATAFNRNHPMTAEGGAIDEEFRLSYVFDRAETVGTAFLGLTMNCARCHDHKFDPLTQKDYYQFAAFFNNIKELGMTGDDGNYGPMLPMTDHQTQEILDFLKTDIEKQKEYLDSLSSGLVSEISKQKPLQGFRMPKPLVYAPLEKFAPGPQSKTESKKFILDNNLNATTPAQPQLVPGKVGQAMHFTGNYDELYLSKVPNFEWTEPFSGGLWLYTTKKENDKTQTLMGTSGEKNNFWRGWDLYLDSSNRLNFRMLHSLPHNYLQVSTVDSIPLNSWTQVFFTYDGMGDAQGVKLYIQGNPVQTAIKYNRLYKSAKTVSSGKHLMEDRAVRVAKSYRGFTGDNGVFKGDLDEIYLYGIELSPAQVALLVSESQNQEFTADPQQVQVHQLMRHPQLVAAKKSLRELKSQWLKKMENVPEVMVMEELKPSREAFAYRRGAYDAPMYQVYPGIPHMLNAFSEDLPANRLGLAQWLFQENNPLTARVTVNRYWQMLFGNGLVNTPHDFGVQGALPTHPKLLDYLALYLQENQWSVKALLKFMVMSHTYQQSSDISEQEWQLDPQNKYLARGPSFRLPAEMIRDNALAASGLLVKKTGGESVRPYQPEGLWIEKGNFSNKLLRYRVTKGDSLYRRSMYTFVKRTSPHPAMTAFDAPNRDVCMVKRENTNTPLQALVLLNDPQFVECSRVLAQRVQKEAGERLDQQIARAFQLVTGREPKDQEMKIFEELYYSQEQRFKNNPQEMKGLLEVGEYPMDWQLDLFRTAALTVVSNTILNHDEAYMKR